MFGETWAMPGRVGSHRVMSAQIRQNRHNTIIKQEQFNYEHLNHYLQQIMVA